MCRRTRPPLLHIRRNGGTRTPDTWFIRPPLLPAELRSINTPNEKFSFKTLRCCKTLPCSLYDIVISINATPTILHVVNTLQLRYTIPLLSGTLIVLTSHDCSYLATLRCVILGFTNFLASTNTTSENRTRILTLKGLCPDRLDDGGKCGAIKAPLYSEKRR